SSHRDVAINVARMELEQPKRDRVTRVVALEDADEVARLHLVELRGRLAALAGTRFLPAFLDEVRERCAQRGLVHTRLLRIRGLALALLRILLCGLVIRAPCRLTDSMAVAIVI